MPTDDADHTDLKGTREGRRTEVMFFYFLKPKEENGGPANHANHAKPKGVEEAEPLLQKGELFWTLELSLGSSPFACFRVVSGQSIPVSRLNPAGSGSGLSVRSPSRDKSDRLLVLQLPERLVAAEIDPAV